MHKISKRRNLSAFFFDLMRRVKDFAQRKKVEFEEFLLPAVVKEVRVL